MNKLDIRKNRDKIRESMKTSLTYRKDDKQQNKPDVVKIYTPQVIYKKHLRTSQQIRLSDDINYLKQTYIQKSFDCMFQLKQKIGEGSHSTVFKCIEISTKKVYAVKVSRTIQFQNLKQIKDQYRIHKTLTHENLLKAYYLFINEKLKKIHMVCEYCAYQDLRQYLRNQKTIQLSQISRILYSVLKGILYLHKHGICHRDIKPDNILYNSMTGQLKLIDFQISKMRKYIHQPLQMWTNTGTLYYKAPQMFIGGYNQLIDMWAVGVVAYELFFRKLPFAQEYCQNTIEAICKKQPEYKCKSLNFTVIYFVDFLKKCLMKEPLKRITAEQAFKTPFMLIIPTKSQNNIQKLKHKPDQIRKNQNNQNQEQNYGQLLKPLRTQKLLKSLSSSSIKQSYSEQDLLNQKHTFSQDIGIRFLQW